MKKNSWKLLTVSALMSLSLAACHSEPATPMEAVMSDNATTKYSIDSYEALSTSNHVAYKEVTNYCHEHRNKPNCENALLAEINLFNRD
jgi:hypothetical protein